MHMNEPGDRDIGNMELDYLRYHDLNVPDHLAGYLVADYLNFA